MDLDMNMNENIERAFEELSVDINSDILDNVSAADTIETLNDTKKKKLTRDIFKKNDTVVLLAKRDQLPVVENMFRISSI